MNKLEATSKITLATLKSFAKRNVGNIFFKEVSSFSGMSDIVESNDKAEWFPSSVSEPSQRCKSGVEGIYTVGSSRDLYELYDDGEYLGIEVYNSCGTTILAVKMTPDIS